MFMSLCVDVIVMWFAYFVNYTGVCGAGVSDVYMLNNVGNRTALVEHQFWRFVSECSVCFTSFVVVCDEFDNYVWGVCLL